MKNAAHKDGIVGDSVEGHMPSCDQPPNTLNNIGLIRGPSLKCSTPDIYQICLGTLVQPDLPDREKLEDAGLAVSG